MADFWDEYRKAGVKAADSDPFWDAYRSGQDPAALVAEEQAPISIQGAAQSDPNSVSSTIGRSVDNLQSNYGGTLEAIGEFTGSEYLRAMGETIRKDNLEEAAQYGKAENATSSEIEGPADVPEYLKQLGLSALPSLGAVGAGAIAGGRIGAFGGTLGVTIGSAVGGMLAGFGMNVGDVQNRIKKENPDLDASGTALGAGAAMSTLDAIGVGVILRPLIKRMGGDVVFDQLVKQGVTKQAASMAIKGALAEGITEVGQEAIGEGATAAKIGRAFNTEQFITNSIDAFLGGTIAGGGVGSIQGAIGAVENNRMISDGVQDTGPIGTAGTQAAGDIKKAWYGIASRPTEALESLANTSETAADFLDTFRRDTRKTTKASKVNIGERQALLAGDWRTKIEPYLGKLTNQDVIDVANGNTSNPKTAPIQSVLKEIRDKAIDTGMDVGKIDNYLPTTLDPTYVAENRDAFVSEIAPYMTVKSKGGVSKPASLAQVNNIVDMWLGETSKVGTDVVPFYMEQTLLDPVTLEAAKTKAPKKPGTLRSKVGQSKKYPEFGQLEKSRTFGQVPQGIIQKYTTERGNPKAVRQAIYDYIEGAAHRIPFSEEFGPNGEKANYKIARIIHESAKNGRSVEMSEVKRMYNMLDAYNHMFSPIESKNVKGAQSVLASAVTVTTLPLVVLSSLTESVLPAVRGEIGVAIRQVAPTLRTIAGEIVRKSFTNAPKSDISLQISQANLSLAATDNVVAARLGQNLYGAGASTFLRGFFKGVGLTHWTHFMRLYSAHVAKSIVDRNISELASGLPTDSARGRYVRTQLAELGIEIKSTAEAKALNAPSTETERQAANDARVMGIRRFVEETILEPNFEDKPLWMSNGHLQLLAQLKGYPTMFTNTILPQVVRRFDPRRVGGYQAAQGFIGMVNVFSFMLLVGYMQDYMKQVIKNGEVNYDEQRTEGQVLLDVLQLTFMPIHASYLLQAVSAPRYGTSGVVSTLGPAAGKAEEGVKTIYNFLDSPEEGEVWRYLYKDWTPFGFYRPGRELAKEADLFE